MTPRTTILAIACLTMVALAPALAQAGHGDCERRSVGDRVHGLDRLTTADAGTYGGPCVGVWGHTGMNGCLMVHWGLHTSLVGVGGDHTCQAHAYANTEAVAVAPPPILP